MNLKIFKIKKSFKKGGAHLRPGTSWKIVLCVAVVLILLSFAFSYNLFMQIDKEFVVTPDGSNTQIKIVKKERITKTLDYFSAREQKSTEILNSPSPVVDPSR